LQILFTMDDLPTFDLPTKTNSGKTDFGNVLKSYILVINSAELIFILSLKIN